MLKNECLQKQTSIYMENVLLINAKAYDEAVFKRVNQSFKLNLTFNSQHLNIETVQAFAGYKVICAFVNDDLNAPVLAQLATQGTQLIALRCAGYNNLDINAAKSLGITVCRVPCYSPEAVAEHTVGLILSLSRKYHKAYNRIREDNFSLQGLLGFNLHNKTVGVVGTGQIGLATIKILQGFGCNVICYDPYPNPDVIALGVKYMTLAHLFTQSDIISLHCPLTPDTHHLINADSISTMKHGVTLINTSRGALIDTQAVINALKTKKIGNLGLDVYEQEADLFFEDLSGQIISDDVFQRLVTFPNVLITGHQGFFTEEALTKIAETTLSSIQDFFKGSIDPNVLCG